MGTAIFNFKERLILERMVKKRRKHWAEHSKSISGGSTQEKGGN